VNAHPSVSMPFHWAEVAFDDLFRNVTSSSRKLPAGSYMTSGIFPVIDQGERYIGGFTNDAGLVYEGALPAIVFGDHTRCIKCVNRPFVQGADGVKVLCPSSNVNPRFCYWALIQADIQSKGYARHFAILRALRLPLAPLREQGRIVEAIESYLSRLDDAMATLERVQRNLKRYRASVLKAAVEGRLVPTEAELARAEGREYEPASVLLERILAERRRRWEEAELAKMKAKGKTPKNDKWKAKYVEPATLDASELPELPEGWCWAGPEQIAAYEKYALGIGPFGSNLKVTDYREEGVPLVFVRNIRAESFLEDGAHYVSVEKAIELKPHIARAGDLLITKMGEPPGDAAIYPFGRPDGVITADCIRLRAHPILISTPYLLSAIRSPIFQGQIVSITKGVAQKKVSLERFKLLAIPIAPLSEQYRIASEIDRLLSVRDAALNTVLRQAQRVMHLRQSILKWAFEGRLADQDPTDEPADVLLERIRAERADSHGKKQPRPRRVNTGSASA
jgi:type I restriction enzyme, S subunit